jgi:hypothetical protein
MALEMSIHDSREHAAPARPSRKAFSFRPAAEPRSTISAAWDAHEAPFSGLDHEIDLQFVLDSSGAASGTDRLNPVVGLLDRGSTYVSSIQFANGLDRSTCFGREAETSRRRARRYRQSVGSLRRETDLRKSRAFKYPCLHRVLDLALVLFRPSPPDERIRTYR